MGNDNSKSQQMKRPLIPQQERAQYQQVTQREQPQELLSIVPKESAEEIRQKRLARFEKSNIPRKDPGFPQDFAHHPIALEYGNKAYLIHMLFEDIYQNTFHKTSVQRNPGLKLLQTHDQKIQIPLYTIENFEDVIPEIMESELFYKPGEKIAFLCEVSQRIQSCDQLGLIPEAKQAELKNSALTFLLNYLAAPLTFSPEMTLENIDSPIDCSCKLYDLFFEKLIRMETENVWFDLFERLQPEYLHSFLTPIFKRIIRDCSNVTTENIKKGVAAIELLRFLLQSERIADFFIEHPLFLPQDPQTSGLQLQKFTIIGSCLSLTAIQDETSSVQSQNEKLPEYIPAIRLKIHTLVDSLHKVIESLIKLNPKYKRNILDWFYFCLKINNPKQTESFVEGSPVATQGWFNNFILLLLKFCQKFLEDPKSYHTWLSKIEIKLVRENEIFDSVELLNGQVNSISKYQDGIEKPKFSFLTELVFITTHALHLHRNSLKAFARTCNQGAGILEKIHIGSLLAKKINSNLFGYRVHFLDPYFANQLFKLLSFETLLILHTFQLPIKSLDSIHILFEQIPSLLVQSSGNNLSLPVYWAQNIQEYLHISAITFIDVLPGLPVCFEILMDFALSVIRNREWMKYPSIKTGFGVFLALLEPTPRMHKFREEDFNNFIKHNVYYEKNLVQGLVELFIDVEELIPKEQIYQRCFSRASCCVVLTRLLQVIFPQDGLSYAIKGLDRLVNISLESYTKFIEFYLEDISFLLNECFSRLNVLQSLLVNLTSYPTADEAEITQLFHIMRTYFEFARCVSEVFPEFFLNSEVRDRVASTLNNAIKVFHNSDSGWIKFETANMKNLKCTPGMILQVILRIYLSLGKNEDFIESVVKDTKSFHIDELCNVAKVAETENYFNFEEGESLTLLVSKCMSKIQVEDPLV